MLKDLSHLAVGDSAQIISLNPGGSAHCRQKLLALGFVPGAKLTVNREAPFGGPLEITLSGIKAAFSKGLTLTLRKQEGQFVLVERIACP